MGVSVQRRAILAGGAALAAGLVATERAAPARAAANGLIRLAANENPYGPADSARRAMAQALEHGWRYGFGEEGGLAALIAAAERVSPEHVALAAGSSEILRLAAIAYGRHGGRVVAATPTFSFLPRYAAQLGCRIDAVPLNTAMAHDLDAMADRVTGETRLIYVCNPNNPTGTLLDPTRLRRFVADLSAAAPVVVDEAYIDLADDPENQSMVDQVRAGRPVIVSRTFSKVHGLAGLRVGYAIAPPDIVRKLSALRVTMPNIVSLSAATASYQDRDFKNFSRARIRECQQIVMKCFTDLGLAYTPSAGNFILFDTGGSVDRFRRYMRSNDILVGGSYAPYESWCRVSMGTVEQMRRFAAVATAYFRA